MALEAITCGDKAIEAAAQSQEGRGYHVTWLLLLLLPVHLIAWGCSGDAGLALHVNNSTLGIAMTKNTTKTNLAALLVDVDRNILRRQTRVCTLSIITNWGAWVGERADWPCPLVIRTSMGG